MKLSSLHLISSALVALLVPALTPSARASDAAKAVPKQTVLTGQAAFTDAAHESPGTRRYLTTADLPAPMPEQSVVRRKAPQGEMRTRKSTWAITFPEPQACGPA